jgi:hypothetical protein
MRDPWFPIVLMLIVLLTVWLGVVGPMPEGFGAWLQKWQSLAAAFVASIAAYIAFQNTSRSLRHAEGLEKHRRSRKHAAIRAVLPLALAQVTEYAEQSAHTLNDLVGKCIGEKLPAMTAPESLVQPLPSETLKTLTDFIEYSDNVDVGVIEATISWIQIHDARLRSIVKENRDPSGEHLVLRTQLVARIIDAASIYAGTATAYDYARRRSANLPRILLWEGVRNALRNMRFWDEEYPSLQKVLTGRENHSVGPFESLNM